MIIAVDGVLIDTTKIYKIGKVIGDSKWRVWTGRDWEYYPDEFYIKHEFKKHSAYSFTVYFLNKKEETFTISGDDKFGEGWTSTIDNSNTRFRKKHEQGEFEVYMEKCRILKNTLTQARNEVLKYWNKDGIDIPLVNF